MNLGATNRPTLTFTFPKTGSNIVLRSRSATRASRRGSCTRDLVRQHARSRCTRSRTRSRSRRRASSPTASRWRVDGTASSTNRNRVAVYSGLALNPALRIGTADVLADGTWSVDARDSTIPVTTCQCVTVVSDRGGQVVDFPLEKPQNLPPTTVDPGKPPAQTLAAARPARAGRGRAARRRRRWRAARFAAPAAVSAAAVGTTGVPVTVAVPDRAPASSACGS